MNPEDLTPEQQKKLKTLKENQIESPFESRVKAVFEKLAVLELEDEEKAKLAGHLQDLRKEDSLYWAQILLSSLIATLGLLQNSVAVIIGAMLIAPLLQPIQVMAFGISSGRSSFFYRALKTLAKSIALAVLLGFICAWVLPIRYQTAEILARTTPNLLDLFIAVFSAILAFLSLTEERLSESIAGVAMAASLMPPLAVVGIEIAFGNWALSWGSFLLFLTNILAILLVGSCFFIAYGYLPHQEFTQQKALKKAALLIVSTILICFPLGSSLMHISQSVSLQSEIQAFTKKFIAQRIPQAEISRVDLLRFDKKEIALLGVIEIPDDIPFFSEFRSELVNQFEARFHRKLTLDLQLVRVAKIISENGQATPDEIIKDKVRSQFSMVFPKGNIIRLDVQSLIDEPKIPSEFIVKLAFVPPVGMGNETLVASQQQIEKAFEGQTIQWLWLPIAQQVLTKEKPSPEEVFQEQQSSLIKAFLQPAMPSLVTIESMDLSWKLISENTTNAETLPLAVPENFEASKVERFIINLNLSGPPEIREDIKVLVEKTLNEKVSKPVHLSIHYKPSYLMQVDSGLVLEEPLLEALGD
ncbi:MAG TPA: TIGR00341 family protein [Candidatus Gracilibacteria bacterium]